MEKDQYIRRYVFFNQEKEVVEKFLSEIKLSAGFTSYDIWRLDNRACPSIGLTKEQAQMSWHVWMYFETYDDIIALRSNPILVQMIENQLWKVVECE